MGLAANVGYTALLTVPGWNQLVSQHLLSQQRSSWGLALASGSLLSFAALYNLHGVCQVCHLISAAAHHRQSWLNVDSAASCLPVPLHLKSTFSLQGRAFRAEGALGVALVNSMKGSTVAVVSSLLFCRCAAAAGCTAVPR